MQMLENLFLYNSVQIILTEICTYCNNGTTILHNATLNSKCWVKCFGIRFSRDINGLTRGGATPFGMGKWTTG